MGLNVISKDNKNDMVNLPIFGAGVDILQGAFLTRGATPGTNNGELIKASGSSAIPDIIGRLQGMLDYSVDGETLIAGTAFVVKPVILAQQFRTFRIEYDLASVITATQAVTTTTITLTSLEDDIDAAFLYVVAGTGLGQTNYLTASAAGSATLKAAFGTSLDTTSTLIKVLPRFHQLGSLNSDGTKLASQAAAGAVKVMVIDTWIQRGSRIEQFNPVKHSALTGLNSVKGLHFFADVAFRDTVPYSVD
jgi:hypothetical protein